MTGVDYFGMTLTRDSPEILRRDRSYKWAEACMERAMATGNQRRAARAARLVTALAARMDRIAMGSVRPYSAVC